MKGVKDESWWGGGVTTVTKRVVGGLTGHFEDVLGGCVEFVGEWVIREY